MRNKAVRSATKTYVKRALAAVAAGETNPTAEAIRKAISALDRAAKKGVLHPNNAARRKSRLMKKVNQAAAAAAPSSAS